MLERVTTPTFIIEPRTTLIFVCGRADNILSQIILDNTEAADKIPKESQGLFVTHDGVVFQGYLFDENNVFAE